MIPGRPFGFSPFFFFFGICKFREEKSNGVHKSMILACDSALLGGARQESRSNGPRGAGEGGRRGKLLSRWISLELPLDFL